MGIVFDEHGGAYVTRVQIANDGVPEEGFPLNMAVRFGMPSPSPTAVAAGTGSCVLFCPTEELARLGYRGRSARPPSRAIDSVGLRVAEEEDRF